jgi:hypothetical protein
MGVRRPVVDWNLTFVSWKPSAHLVCLGNDRIFVPDYRPSHSRWLLFHMHCRNDFGTGTCFICHYSKTDQSRVMEEIGVLSAHKEETQVLVRPARALRQLITVTSFMSIRLTLWSLVFMCHLSLTCKDSPYISLKFYLCLQVTHPFAYRNLPNAAK